VGIVEASADDRRLQAESVRKLVDERGGRLESKVKPLLDTFGYKKLTPERGQQMDVALREVAVRTNPPLSAVGGRLLSRNPKIVVERDQTTGTQERQLSAEAVRRVVDEQGGRSKSRVKALLDVFGYAKLTPEQAQQMDAAGVPPV
jgi:hypothetical protein